jgi:hypothetical protein
VGDWNLTLKIPSQPIPKERTDRYAMVGSYYQLAVKDSQAQILSNLSGSDYHNNVRHSCTGDVTGSTAALVDRKRAAAGNKSWPAVRNNNCSPVALGNHPSHDDRGGVSNRIHAIPSHDRGQPQRTKTRR